MGSRLRISSAAGILAVAVLAAATFSFVYPFTMNERSAGAADIPGHDADPSFTESYAFEAEITVHEDGTLSERRHIEFVVDDAEVVERDYFHPTVDGRAIELIRYFDRDEEWRSDLLQTNDSETMDARIERKGEDAVVDQYTDDDGYVLVTTNEESDSVEDRAVNFYTRSIAVPEVRYPHYEQADERTFAERDVTVYEPQGGWYYYPDTTPPFADYRLIDVDGELYVDDQTGTILYADMSYTVVEAANYAEYMHSRWQNEGMTTIEIHYEFSDDGEVDRPEWAEEPD